MAPINEHKHAFDSKTIHNINNWDFYSRVDDFSFRWFTVLGLLTSSTTRLIGVAGYMRVVFELGAGC